MAIRNVEVRLGESAVSELVAKDNAGAQSTDPMLEYNLSKSSVLSILRKHGGKLRRQGLSRDQEALAVDLRDQGMSYLRIAERLGAAKSTVQLWLKQQAAHSDARPEPASPYLRPRTAD